MPALPALRPALVAVRVKFRRKNARALKHLELRAHQRAEGRVRPGAEPADRRDRVGEVDHRRRARRAHRRPLLARADPRRRAPRLGRGALRARRAPAGRGDTRRGGPRPRAGGDVELVVRRELSAEGRGRVFVNNRLATLSLLRNLRPMLVDIHGQGTQQTLFDPETHLELLDAFADLRPGARRSPSRTDAGLRSTASWSRSGATRRRSFT